MDGLELYVLDAAHLFYRDGGPYAAPDGYDWWDNPERFAALCWMGARLAHEGHLHGWQPDVVHAHDWQGGFTPVYMQRVGRGPSCRLGDDDPQYRLSPARPARSW